MLNQFYKFVVNKVFKHFENLPIQAGDRFYLRLDSKDEVNSIIETIKETQKMQKFEYKHDEGNNYETIYVPIGNINLIIANTSEKVKPDYLALIRNEVSFQNGQFENTALLSVLTEDLETIPGGSTNLQKEGMPLHVSSIYKDLGVLINKNCNNKATQQILKDSLSNIMKEHELFNVNFLEFEEIYNLIYKSELEPDDYPKFNLFYDPDLETFTGKSMHNRIELNRELFEFVKDVHEYGFEEEKLQVYFTNDGSRELIKEDWRKIDFAKVHQDYEKNIKINKSSEVTFESLKETNKLDCWIRNSKDNAAGRRKKHIIVFNPAKIKNINLEIKFSLGGKITQLKSEFLKTKGQKDYVNITTKNKTLLVDVETLEGEATYLNVKYSHDHSAKLGAEFFIAIVPFDETYLLNFKTTYKVKSKESLLEFPYEFEDIAFGNSIESKEIQVIEYGQHIVLEKDQKTIVKADQDLFDDESQLKLDLEIEKTSLSAIIKSEIPDAHPITGQRISKLIREEEKSFQWVQDNNRLILGNQEFYFHKEYEQFFKWEYEWMNNLIYHATVDSSELSPQTVKLNANLREAYSRFLNALKIKKTIPSLSYLDPQLKERAEEYVNEYNKTIASFKEGIPIMDDGVDLFKLGTISNNDIIYLTPFHPLMVAYKLELYKELSNEQVENNILNRLTPEGLLPFIHRNGQRLFKPDHQKAANEWLVYRSASKVTVSDANQYLANIVYDKINQFKEHFSYLFINQSNAPIQINVININNDLEIVRGIIKWMIKELDKVGFIQLKPIEVTLYTDTPDESNFDQFSQVNNIEKFEHMFNINLKSKDYEKEDVLRLIRDKIFFYKKENKVTSNNLKYAHITFYKMHAQQEIALQNMKEMNTGIAMEGIYSTIASMRDTSTYKSGFGTKSYQIDENQLLLTTAFRVNELAANVRNGGYDSFHKNQAILSRTTTTDRDKLNEIFNSSHWVTFVDPGVDLEFFQTYGDGVVIIHYSDQYTSSSRFDAITVTNKSEQYASVIKEFLLEKDVDCSNESVNNTIKAFNTFNGEWLLRIIGSKGQYDREKLSIVSAIKYTLAYFDHPNILWVPISLEEILRVAGVFNLSKNNGVFTAKNLGISGNTSDDLLLIGLEKIEDQYQMYFYPVEVKIGINQNTVIDKARSQVKQTADLFEKIFESNEDQSFINKFYRNFFVQLFLANAKKIAHSNLWSEKNYDIDDQIIEALLKNKFKIKRTINKYIGIGAIVSFEKDAYKRNAYLDLESQIQRLNLTMQDGYSGITKSIQFLKEFIHEKSSDFNKATLLATTYVPGLTNEIIQPTTKSLYEIDENGLVSKIQTSNRKDPQMKNNENGVTRQLLVSDPPLATIEAEPEISNEDTNELENSKQPVISKNLMDIRIKIGEIEGLQKNVYWEFGSYGQKGITNRHLLISGKSGQGKTYLMQCLLLELSKQGISSLIIDYTDGFLTNQLNPVFVEALGDHLKERLVYVNKLPINPFARNKMDWGGLMVDETDIDIAERIKSVFSAVYPSLGIQQQNTIYEAVLEGIRRYGDQMSLIYLKEILEEEGSSTAKKTLSQIRPLIDRNPFLEGDSINWKEHIESNGDVFIIQLKGYNRDVQLLITEFILWDLWNYSKNNGSEDKPMPVILDEAQNLDHREGSPSAYILTEGRKFGWSGWYATQFMRTQMDASEVSRLQNSALKLYFSPPEQELSNIASSLSPEPQEKKKWEQTLNTLSKGQCVFSGQTRLDDGNLSQPISVVVNIANLESRL